MNSEKSVVITGASSGIGYSSVARMIATGWTVFATVRKAEDAERLKADFGERVTPLLVDVTDHRTINDAKSKLEDQLAGRGLDGLVNVAGIGMMRPLEYATEHDLREIFEINVFGQIAITQALLPLLRKARGRVVNITSVGTHLTIPFGGLLNASKSAFAALSNALRVELRPFGLHVCVIEPGAINTPAVGKTLGDVEGVIARLPANGAQQYGSILRKFARRAYAMESRGSSPAVVARAVHHALTSARPRVRYLAGKHARVLTTLPKLLPTRVMDALIWRMLGSSKPD